MPTGSFYVYALFDPRDSTTKPFYIGKGSGSRAYAHMEEQGEGRKNHRIREIKAAGQTPVVRQLVAEVSEFDALRIEAQLIAAHGTLETGGCLLNKIVPNSAVRERAGVHLPAGAAEKAQLGLKFLKEAILEFAAANAEGVTNAEVVNYLGLQSDYLGEQRNYLSWSLLGILMREGRVRLVKNDKPRLTKYQHVQVGATGTA